MASIKNFFSRIFLSKGDSGPTNEKKHLKASTKRRSSVKDRLSLLFRQNSSHVNDQRKMSGEGSEATRRHSDVTGDLDTADLESCTRLSLDGTCLIR